MHHQLATGAKTGAVAPWTLSQEGPGCNGPVLEWALWLPSLPELPPPLQIYCSLQFIIG